MATIYGILLDAEGTARFHSDVMPLSNEEAEHYMQSHWNNYGTDFPEWFPFQFIPKEVK